MAAPRDTRRTRAAKSAPTRPIELPTLPPKTEAELAHEQDMIARLRAASEVMHQRNLNNAVRLAQQAASGYGPLAEHFAELGRRYSDLLTSQPRPRFRVVKGGAA